MQQAILSGQDSPILPAEVDNQKASHMVPVPSVSIAMKIQEYWTSIFEVGMLVSSHWVMYLCTMLARNVPGCWKLQSRMSSFSVSTPMNPRLFMPFTENEPKSHGVLDSMPSLTFWHHESWFREAI